MSPKQLAFLLLLTFGGLYLVDGTYRYYGSYLSYGTGETYVWVLHMYGGPRQPHRKWLVECQDGEAMTGLQDFAQDFERVEVMKCQFMFPNKPPSMGRYPYYPSCHVKNYTNQYFCYDPNDHDQTVNTFVTGLWDTADFLWQVFRPGADDIQPYKCCKTPQGYYIDYVSCYYMPTHDLYFEYYDSPSSMITMCTTGYIVTGISKKINPWTSLYNVDYIQCCRLGFGPNQAFSPPLLQHGKDQTPVYYSRQAIERVEVPEAYRAQYKRLPPDANGQAHEADNVTLLSPVADDIHVWSSRYAPAKPMKDFTEGDDVSLAKAWPTNTVI